VRDGGFDSILDIDLDAVAANWRGLRARLRRGCEAAALVKADAYGLGMAQVAPRLARAGCRLFFVADIEEGARLRRLLPAARIAVLNGFFPAQEGEFARARLMPVLNDLGQIAAWRKRKAARKLPAMIHLDTGMARLGLPKAEAERLSAEPDLLEGVELAGLLSHLACADDSASAMNRIQREAFSAMLKNLPRAPASLASSSGIFLGPDYHFDFVRPGAALYGINPLPDRPNPMAPTVKLKARILQVRTVEAGQSVGYDSSHQMARSGRVATVGVGYADGWFRAASGRASVGVGGRRAPIIGRISMDLLTIDVTGIPPESARPGTYVDLLDEHYGVDDFARDAGTIGYEVLTALAGKHHRRYRGEVR
jgi:alanine racemase